MSLSHVVAAIRSYLRYRASVRALAVLSDRELADIGVMRSEIDRVARRSVMA